MKSSLFAAALAATLCVALPALAQPFGGGTPLMMLGKVKSQLNLNTSQQQQWDAVLAQSKTARETARANFAQVRSALQAELAKPEPDFAAVAAVSDSVHQQNAALHKQVRDAWLALYANFTPEQKATARDAIQTGLQRFAARRAAMHQGAKPSTE
jgi:Spy/CpxP family protein refolding chaperone